MAHKITFLMSIYTKEKPDYLEQSLKSLWEQSNQNFTILMVVDGELAEALESVLARWQKEFGIDRFSLLRLKKTPGLGVALNKGLEKVTSEYIARFDTDDICLPHRVEEQIKYAEQNPGLAVFSSPLIEFQEGVEKKRLKPVPVSQKALKKMLPYRNPINHPSALVKVEAIRAVGGYQHFPFLEDYFLWVRMCSKGYAMANQEEPLVMQRVNADTYGRRGGVNQFVQEVKLRAYIYSHGLSSVGGFIGGALVQIPLRLTPSPVRSFLWKLVRKPTPSSKN